MQITNAKFTCNPFEVGYDASRIDVLNDFLKEQIDRNAIRAAIYCLSRDGKVFADTAVGDLSYEKSDNRPLQPDSIFRIASITKLFCATAIFKLVEDGKIRLTQSVCDFIPEMNESPFNQLNFTHLLAHTSGFAPDPGTYAHTGKEEKNVWEVIEKAFEKGDKDWIKAAMSIGFRNPIGEQWAYSSFGYALLGEIVSRISGRKAEDYITENILKPCGMTDTFFWKHMSNHLDKLDRIVINNEYDKKGVEETKKGVSDPGDMWSSVPDTGGGIYSTAADLVKFGTMLMNGGRYEDRRILGRKAVEKMTSVHTGTNVLDFCWQQPGVYRRYGLGPDMRRGDDFIYSEETFFHEGSGKCALLIDPREKLVAVYYIPYLNESVWDPIPIWNTISVIWSGLI